jgi:hypothetical protein
VAGTIIFANPIVGTIVGGIVGGVGIGLYAKFVIPETVASLIELSDKLDKLIHKSGKVYYSSKILDILKINESFLLKHKPKGMIQ